MRRLTGFLFGITLLGMTAAPAAGQADAWQRKWFWGGQGGVVRFQDQLGWATATTIGGHWLITGRRSALYVSYDQMFFPTGSSVVVDDGTATGTTVGFSDGRRLGASLLAVPSDGSLQIYVGGGFSIHEVSDPTITATSLSPDAAQQRADAVASKAFLQFMGGIQLRMGRSWALFGNYIFVPGANEYLIQSDQHVISGGLRVVLSSAHEDVTTER